MKLIADTFALIGLCATIIFACFWAGYATYAPNCHTVAALFTKECK
jgi:hypothetical protein